jgi:hypothetical protein
VAVVVAEREPKQVRVERAAHVELDAERLLSRNQATPDHEERPREADAEDGCDDQLERVLVVSLHRAPEAGAGQERRGELRSLRQHREDDRDGEGPLVRPQEPQQPTERLSVRSRRHPRQI